MSSRSCSFDYSPLALAPFGISTLLLGSKLLSSSVSQFTHSFSRSSHFALHNPFAPPPLLHTLPPSAVPDTHISRYSYPPSAHVLPRYWPRLFSFQGPPFGPSCVQSTLHCSPHLKLPKLGLVLPLVTLTLAIYTDSKNTNQQLSRIHDQQRRIYTLQFTSNLSLSARYGTANSHCSSRPASILPVSVSDISRSQ